jgi:glyoxylase I family protein
MSMVLGIDHPAIAAENVETLAAWYCDVLEYTRFWGGGKQALLLRGPDGAFLEIMPPDGTPRPERTAATPGWSHLAYRVRDWEAAVRRLDALGVRWAGEAGQASGGGRVRSFFDPEGNLVQIVHRAAAIPLD